MLEVVDGHNIVVWSKREELPNPVDINTKLHSKMMMTEEIQDKVTGLFHVNLVQNNVLYARLTQEGKSCGVDKNLALVHDLTMCIL